MAVPIRGLKGDAVMSAMFTPLALANGGTVPNRLAKAAMEESLAVAGQAPGEGIVRLYRAWAEGGAGLIITGNVMVDARALTGPGTIVLDAACPLEPFRRWATAAKSGGGQVWMQINHPGRQVMADMPGVAWAPSAVRLDVGRQSRLFARPAAMSEKDIAATTARFADTARLAELAGFDGVEVHAAHGYLISQFLSPRSNRRDDRYGGSLGNRARLLVETIEAVRAAVSPGFAVAVKLNSTDFQRGGFDVDDARQVITMLGRLRVDLVELSGGSYESPAMLGTTADGRRLAREAYFLSFARQLLDAAEMPIMVTGGVRRREVAEAVLDTGVAAVGMATALAVRPDLPRHWRQGPGVPVEIRRVHWRDRMLAAAANQAVVRHQLARVAAGKPPAPGARPLPALLRDEVGRRRALRRYRRWLPTHPGTPGHR